jgi:hypothetical protein
MKRALSLLALAALTACGGGGEYTLEIKKTDATTTPTTPVVPVTPAPVCTLEIVGDSIASGLGVDEKPEQVLMRLRPKWTAKNTSVSGELANQRITHFYSDVRTARFILLEHGINDLYAAPAPNGIDPVPALRNMAAYVKAEGRTPILTGLFQQVTPHPLRASADARIGALAAETGTPYANVGTVAIDLATEMQDTSHPKQSGSVKMVQRWIATLDALAPECKGAL